MNELPVIGSLYLRVMKMQRISVDLSPKWLFFRKSKRPIAIHFFLATTNVCHVAIPEIFAHKQGFDNWQLIH